jgi:hypothetical protein
MWRRVDLAFFIVTAVKTQILNTPIVVCWPSRCLETGSSTVACVFVAAGICLPSHCLAMYVCSGSTVPAFRRHVTLHLKHKFLRYVTSCITLLLHTAIESTVWNLYFTRICHKCGCVICFWGRQISLHNFMCWFFLNCRVISVRFLVGQEIFLNSIGFRPTVGPNQPPI